MYSFVKKLQFVKYHLKIWNRRCFGNISCSKREAQECLDVITQQIRYLGFTIEFGNTESWALKDMEEWELREEIF